LDCGVSRKKPDRWRSLHRSKLLLSQDQESHYDKGNPENTSTREKSPGLFVFIDKVNEAFAFCLAAGIGFLNSAWSRKRRDPYTQNRTEVLVAQLFLPYILSISYFQKREKARLPSRSIGNVVVQIPFRLVYQVRGWMRTRSVNLSVRIHLEEHGRFDPPAGYPG
jgi:hypothetical protein